MKLLFSFLIGMLSGGLGTFFWVKKASVDILATPLVQTVRPLDAYTIEALGRRVFTSAPITLHEAVATTSGYTAYRFSFLSDGKKVTGLAHVPTGEPPRNGFPVIVQLRGFVPKENYETGVGTRRSGQVFAGHGFLTIAPDFLGYGGSDEPSEDVFRQRFETYTVTANLIASLGTLTMVDKQRIGIWGHSNGGQIALTTLEILQKPYPTVLWAPVTKPFPYSILYYSDEATDSGKLLRKHFATFEKLYDTDLYSLTNYLYRITAPLQIHQGTGDDAVPVSWSDDFVDALSATGKDITYFIYPGADHNLVNGSPSAWNLAVGRSIEFYRKHLR